jgi:hypothetical protein
MKDEFGRIRGIAQYCRVCQSAHMQPDAWASCINHLQKRLARLEKIFENTDFAKVAEGVGVDL